MSPPPLHGRRVLVTRPRGRGASLAERLEKLGARVSLVPTIAFEPPRDMGPARSAVHALDRYAWIAFSSATGVRFFVDLVERERGADASGLIAGGGARVAVIGGATRRVAEDAGVPVVLEAGDSRSEGLAAALAKRVTPGDRVLWVRPEVARDVLPEQLAAVGAAVDSVAFYRTVASPEAASAARAVERGELDVVLFTSPSTVRGLLEAGGSSPALLEALKTLRRVAIGKVTAAALAEQGLTADRVAQDPGEAALVEAVRSLFPG